MTKNIALGVVGATIFMFLFEWVVHGIVLMDMYEATSNLWRAPEDTSLPYMIFIQVLTALTVALFASKYHVRGGNAGLRFGVWVGVIYAVYALAHWGFMPISFTLAAIWAVVSVVEMAGVGAIVGYFNKG